MAWSLRVWPTPTQIFVFGLKAFQPRSMKNLPEQTSQGGQGVDTEPCRWPCQSDPRWCPPSHYGLFLCLSFCLSGPPSIHWLSLLSFIPLSVYPSLYLSVHSSACLSVCHTHLQINMKYLWNNPETTLIPPPPHTHSKTEQLAYLA